MSALDDVFSGDLLDEAQKADFTATIRLYGKVDAVLLDEAKTRLTTMLVELIKLYKLEGGTVELHDSIYHNGPAPRT